MFDWTGIYTSSDSGMTWMLRFQTSTNYWSGIATSSDGAKLAAVETGGMSYTKYIFLDWVVMVKIVNILVGYVYTSINYGDSWTNQPASVPSGFVHVKWVAVASSSDGNLLAAVSAVSEDSLGNTTSSYVHTSTDSGVTWSQSSYLFTGILKDIASSSDGHRLVIASYNGKEIQSSLIIT